MEMKKRIAVIYGDGVGPEMMKPALRVLETVCRRFGHEIELLPVEAAGDAILKYGTPLPETSVEICRNADAVLFGNSGLRRFNDYPPEKRPEYALLRLRKELKVTTNIRPIRIYRKLMPLSPLRQERLKGGMDMVFVRDIVGGVLASEKKKGVGSHGQEAYEYEYYNEDIIRQTAEIAFSLAEQRRRRVTSLDKANVLGSSRLWRKTVEITAKEYPDISLENCFVDSGAMQLIREPWRFDVVLSSNMFGDIISDEGTELTGTPFLYGSAEINSSGKGIYTPNQLHWGDESAIGRQIVNPIGMIEAVRLMLQLSFGWQQEAGCIGKAISEVLNMGYATPDIMLEGSRQVSTDKMGELIAEAVG